MIALGVACLLFAFLFALADGSPRLAFALPDAAHLAASELKAREIDLRDRNTDVVLPLLANHLALADVLAQVLLNFTLNDLLKTQMVSFDACDHRLGIRIGELLPLHVTAREDGGHEGQNIRRTDFAVAVALNQPAFHDIDFFLRALVDDIRH